MHPPEFSLVLVGDVGVGKTTFMFRLLTEEFQKSYIPTRGVQNYSLRLDTTCGPVVFNVRDFAGASEANDGSKPGYYLGQCAIIMYDMRSPHTFESLRVWHRDVLAACGNIPVVLVGNKMDVRDVHFVKESEIQAYRERGLQHCEISVRTASNIYKPLLWLARRLTGHSNLEFVEVDGINAATVLIPYIDTSKSLE